MPRPSRAVDGQAVDRHRWRDAILSELGPANPIARVVLLAVAQHMKADGTGAWPSQQTLAARAGVGERSARRHLDIAARLGWIERERVRRAGGRNWYFTEYCAVVPPAVYDSLPERPWEADPDWRRRPARVAATDTDNRPHGPVLSATTGQSVHEYRPETTRVPATVAATTGQSGRLTLSENSFLELSQGRCADAHRVFPKVKTENQEGSQPEPSHKALPSATSEVLRETVNQNVDAIVKLHRQGYGAGEIAKLLARRGIDTDRVRAVIDQHVRKFVL